MTNEEKISILLANDWCDYVGDTWIKKSWITNALPYDLMTISLDDAFHDANLSNQPHPFDKYHQIALEELKNDRTRN